MTLPANSARSQRGLSSGARLGRLTRLPVVVPPVALALLAELLALKLATNPLVAAAIAASVYPLAALLVDRRLPADIRRLAHAKSDLQA